MEQLNLIEATGINYKGALEKWNDPENIDTN